MKPTAHNLKKLEDLVHEGGYTLRYEKGTFQSGYCVLQTKKVVVLNKFLQTDGRFYTLLDLITTLHLNFDALTLQNQHLLQSVLDIAKNAAQVLETHNNSVDVS